MPDLHGQVTVMAGGSNLGLGTESMATLLHWGPSATQISTQVLGLPDGTVTRWLFPRVVCEDEARSPIEMCVAQHLVYFAYLIVKLAVSIIVTVTMT